MRRRALGPVVDLDPNDTPARLARQDHVHVHVPAGGTPEGRVNGRSGFTLTEGANVVFENVRVRNIFRPGAGVHIENWNCRIEPIHAPGPEPGNDAHPTEHIPLDRCWREGCGAQIERDDDVGLCQGCVIELRDM